MYVVSTDLQDFRNYRSLSVTFSEGINVFCGANAQGKTNILEAVYLMGTTRSHRGAKDRDMIRKGAEEAHLRSQIKVLDGNHRIDLHLKKYKSKGIAIDLLPVKKAGDLLNLSKMVFFSPEDLQIIKNGPAVRRRFLNQEMSRIDRVYLAQLTEFNRALAQRNKLLKDYSDRAGFAAQLDLWDAQLIRTGTKIIEQREAFIRKIRVITAGIHQSLTDGKEEILLRYEPNVSSSLFAEELAKARDRDMHLKETTVGPHRDDMGIFLGSTPGQTEMMDSRLYGSQGQQRTAALSLKMAEIEMIRKETGETPVLLLDDVLSELDEVRQLHLLKSIRGTQTMITCTGLAELKEHGFSADRIFTVSDGAVTVL